MLTSICLSDISGRDYTGQLIHENHELNGNTISNIVIGEKPRIIIDIKKPPTDEYYDGVGIVDRIGDNTPNPPVIPLYRSSATGTFTKNDCGSGFQGTTSQFTVNTTSSISQADADSKAQTLLAQQGQTYVNSIGSCLCNLKWEYPTIQYKDGKAYINAIVVGATQYAINNGTYQSENQFILVEDGEYTLQARNAKCFVEGSFLIKIGVDYNITDIEILNVVCDTNFPDDATITDLVITQQGCNSSPSYAIDDIIIVQTGCNISEKADINSIVIKNSC